MRTKLRPDGTGAEVDQEAVYYFCIDRLARILRAFLERLEVVVPGYRPLRYVETAEIVVDDSHWGDFTGSAVRRIVEMPSHKLLRASPAIIRLKSAFHKQSGLINDPQIHIWVLASYEFYVALLGEPERSLVFLLVVIPVECILIYTIS